jgi:hypothetical protein
MNLVSLKAETFIVTTSEQPLCFAYAKLGRLFPIRQPPVKVPADIWPAPLTLANGPFTLIRIYDASFSKTIRISQIRATLWTKLSTIGNLCLALATFHKAAPSYSRLAQLSR